MKALKLFLIIVLVLVLIFVGGFFLLTGFLKTPEFKAQVLDAARKATGAEVKVDEMKISIFSGIDLQGVTVGDILTAKAFALHYRLLPLLQKRVEVETLMIDSPVITLAKGEDGKWNYEKIGGESKPATPKPSAPSPKSSSGSSLDISISKIELKNATVVMLKGPGKELLHISDANFSSTVDLTGGKLTGNGNASIDLVNAANSLFIRKIKTSVAITTDVVKIAPLSGKLADGDVSGDAGLIGSKYSVNLQIKNADVVKLVREAGVAKQVFSSGKLQSTTAITGTGGLETINGTGKAEITNGQLVDIPILNLVATLLQVSALQNLKFDECVLEYTIADNVMQTTVISLKSPQVQITGSGSVALEDYSLKHNFTLALAKGTLDNVPKEVRNVFTQKPDGSFAIDFKVWGPYDSPKTDLDKRILKGAAEQLLQKYLK